MKQKNTGSQQLDIFSSSLPPFKFTKPIKVIELFAGYGSQMLAFEYLGASAQHFKICEWAVPSIEAYNDIHVRDYTDYSAGKDVGWLIDWLVSRGISLDYNRAVTEKSSTILLPNHNRQALWNGYRIRKLTPRECFRLMGVKDEDFDKIKDKISQTWLYHLAVDSIVVNVLMAIFGMMF